MSKKELPLKKIWKNIEKWAALVAILFTIITFIYTFNNDKKIEKLTEDSAKRENYLDKTNFNIVQNLWQDKPSYTLYNESAKPLTIPPQPSYYMYVPAKLYYILKDGTRMSNLILLPVSYENVISQTSTGKTIDEIETSVLSKNFYGKLGARDLRSKFYGKPLEDDIAFELRVYPFLAIATHIEYSYKDNPSKIISENFITTPWGKEMLSDKEFLDLENYTRNIAHFPENEVIVKDDVNVYDSAFKYLETQFDNLLPMFDSGFETVEEQQRFYALMGTRWDMELDSSKSIEEYGKPNEDNFNSIARKLSDKVIPAKDPLYPDY